MIRKPKPKETGARRPSEIDKRAADSALWDVDRWRRAAVLPTRDRRWLAG